MWVAQLRSSHSAAFLTSTPYGVLRTPVLYTPYHVFVRHTTHQAGWLQATRMSSTDTPYQSSLMFN
jgi:hypothetical protein